ncbi:MAG: hypothetical protein KGI28_09945 [Thaumarchaeota archaeon]|nr:hypothetical protein [Nitrososphaerota archaeon]
MPRKEYKTITVKNETFNEFIKEKKIARMQNSEFIEDLLLTNRRKKKFYNKNKHGKNDDQ